MPLVWLCWDDIQSEVCNNQRITMRSSCLLLGQYGYTFKQGKHQQWTNELFLFKKNKQKTIASFRGQLLRLNITFIKEVMFSVRLSHDGMTCIIIIIGFFFNSWNVIMHKTENNCNSKQGIFLKKWLQQTDSALHNVACVHGYVPATSVHFTRILRLWHLSCVHVPIDWHAIVSQRCVRGHVYNPAKQLFVGPNLQY